MNALIQEWHLDASLHSKEEILAALAHRIAAMLAQDPMGFIQTMYRLDIPEARLEAAMDADDSAQLIAELVWDRQTQKAMMRAATPPQRADDDEALAW